MTTKSNTLPKSNLFEQFLTDKRYVQNVSQHTLNFYSCAFQAFSLPTLPPTQAELNNAIVRMRESGKSANCVNAYIRGINPFLGFLFLNGHRSKVQPALYKKWIVWISGNEVLRRSTMFIVSRFLISLRSSGAQSVFASWDYMPLLTERDVSGDAEL
jgi:hypothetical protein